MKLMGGNSNWRGPVWFPTTYLLIHSFLRFGDAVGEDFALPTAGTNDEPVTPHEMAREAANRMISIFKRGADGKRPCFGYLQEIPGRSALEAIACCSTSTTTATPEWASARATRPAGAAW